MLLFSRVRIAREVLTDQGSCFMSSVMKDLLSLLQVKQLHTSVYHPQTDGLVERFNKMLKQMLKKVMDIDGKNWDQLLPRVLFAVREVPQAATGFSPFELLYGRRPRPPRPRQGGVGESAINPSHHGGPRGAGEGPHGAGHPTTPGCLLGSTREDHCRTTRHSDSARHSERRSPECSSSVS